MSAYLNEHRGYIGSTGSGKSTTARVDVEKLLQERRHTGVIDLTGIWYGLRSDRAGTGPGFDVPIFGGRRGDVPIGAMDGAAIGRIVGDGVSAIVDLSALRSGPDQRLFLRDFIAALRCKPAGHFQLVCDEADEYIPEKGGIRDTLHNQILEDMIWIAKRGRTDGFVLSIVTQRLADVANAAFSQVKTIFAHQLIAPSDMDAFGKYVKRHGTKAELDELMTALPSLAIGERYFYRPAQHILERGRTPLPITFDSSRTPEPGAARREPKLLSQIDVAAIAAALKKPREEEAIAAYAAGAEVGQLLIEKDARIGELEDDVQALTSEVDRLSGHLEQRESFVRAIWRLVEPEIRKLDQPALDLQPADANSHEIAGRAAEGSSSPPRQPPAGEGEARPIVTRAAASPAKKPAGNTPAATTKLTKAQRELLGALAWWEGMGNPQPTRDEIAAKVGWKPKGSHLRNRLAELSSQDLVRYPAPSRVSLTGKGAAAAPDPDLSESLLGSIRAVLSGAQEALFDVLLNNRRTWTRRELAEWLGWEAGGSHLRNRLAELSALSIVEYPAGGEVRLRDWVQEVRRS